MRKVPLISLMLGITVMGPTGAFGRDLAKNEQSFVAILATAPIVAGTCNSRVVPTSFRRIADSLGVEDSDALFKATMAAIDVLSRRNYTREDLVPAVTRFVGEVADTVAGDFSDNKAEACKRYLKVLRESGAVE